MGERLDDGALRITVLDHTAVLGGAELALVRLLDHLDPGLQTRTVLFSDGPLAAKLAEAGHPVEVLALDPALANTDRHEAGRSRLTALANAMRVLPFTVRLGLRLRRLAPDVIYTTSLKADLLGVPAAWIAGVPLVWHVHDRISPDYLPGPMVRLLQLLARRVVRRVVVNSEGTAATLPGIHPAIAYPGYDPAQVGPSPAERTIPTPPVVGILGRISPTKGQLEFVRAAERVLARHPEARFRIIGAPLFGEQEYADRVQAVAQELGIADRVEFTGFVADPAAALDGLTVCVHASGQPEPFGQVIVEAMIRGVPVVATQGGGVTEIVRPDPAAEPLGWLVPPYDVAALAAAIDEVLEDPAEAEHRATAAWHSAQERFSVHDTAAVVASVLREAAARR
ncbi:Glycosyltransferase involved in cell wall bisynthesis [Raineyella antarctica]|uniref:Glycosyltransferase involved in cell wall bisynthesis n=1 Tax=Raineyella antarctica TaxID=1577474 RepID=A0A1G6GD10_9ACTN|nr:glycosyltransferase [Raineyella antarctica]SDB79854.1 Glycosyltransferase involved in cell wall bisynthesis [Raineyella antarctica]